MARFGRRNQPVRCIGLLLLVCGVLPAGCSRAYYRTQADQDVQQLVYEKSNSPRWSPEGFTIRQDPRSRYYSPYDPDFPPMPPDDPAAHEFMHHVDGKEGYDEWHESGDIQELENPGWRAQIDRYAETTEDGRIVLDLDDAVRLAYIHSPDWQEQLETVYLSALDVSTERFRFDVQFLQSFSGSDLNFQHRGSEAGPNPGTDTLSLDTDLQARRRLATAGEILVGFANSFVWQFAGPDESSIFSALNFSVVQPLLRNAGRAIALETLTIAERGLLANLRALARYRKGFFTDIAVGDQGVSEPQRRGGFFGGTGLTGFTGQGAAGFGGVGQATGFGRGGFGGGGAGGAGGAATGFAGGGAGLVGGYLGLLQQRQQIRNTQASLDAQLRTLDLLEANLEAGLIDIVQVDQFRQNIETERANLLQAENGFETSLDNYKVDTLGLPPELPVKLDVSLIEQFQFITPAITELQGAVSDFLEQFGELPQQPAPEDLQEAFERADELRQRVAEQFETTREDLQLQENAASEREQTMEADERELFRAMRSSLNESYQRLQSQFDEITRALKGLEEDLDPDNREETANAFVGQIVELSNLLSELSLIQARSRLEAVTVRPVDLSWQEAVEIARAYRLDWMNNRAALVDTWRLIKFNANDLRSNLSVEFGGDISTLGDNPVKFRDDTGSLQAALRFDGPFNRLVERNNYRQQLIEYQQARRQLIQFEDRVKQSLRNTLRQLEQLRVNLEIQRRAVAIAVRRVDQTREVLNQPPEPTEPGQPPQALGPTAAQNLLTALSDLRNAQNNFMSVWLNYYATRMTLMRDLGLMRLDERGMWIDEPIEEALAIAAQNTVYPPATEMPAVLSNVTADDGWSSTSEDAPAVPPVPSDESSENGSAPGPAYRRPE